MRNWISVGAIALACTLAAGRADATYYTAPKSNGGKTQVQTSLGSLLTGLFGNGKTGPIFTFPVMTLPKAPVVTVPGKPALTIADLIKDLTGKTGNGKTQLADLIEAVLDKAKDKDKGGWHFPGDGHSGCKPTPGTGNGGGNTGIPPVTDPKPPVTDPTPTDPLPPIGGGTDDPIAAVPEPASWLTMIAGFGLVGVGLRSRRRSLAAA